MNMVITVLGLVIVVVAAGFLGVRHARRDLKAPLPKGEILIGFGIGFLGLLLLVSSRITSLPTPFGTVHTAAQQALADAGDISALKTQAQTQTATINLVADQATKANTLSETVAGQINEAKAKLAALNTALLDAKDNLEKMKQEEDFTMTVLAAQDGDDRNSFDKLKAIASDDKNTFSKFAIQAYVSIVMSNNMDFYQKGYTVPWTPGVDPSKLTMSQLTATYKPGQPFNVGLLEYINSRNDIPKSVRLAFFIHIMSTDKSLRCVRYAGIYFIMLSGHSPINPMLLDNLLAWWHDHQKDFDGK